MERGRGGELTPSAARQRGAHTRGEEKQGAEPRAQAWGGLREPRTAVLLPPPDGELLVREDALDADHEGVAVDGEEVALGEVVVGVHVPELRLAEAVALAEGVRLLVGKLVRRVHRRRLEAEALGEAVDEEDVPVAEARERERAHAHPQLVRLHDGRLDLVHAPDRPLVHVGNLVRLELHEVDPAVGVPVRHAVEHRLVVDVEALDGALDLEALAPELHQADARVRGAEEDDARVVLAVEQPAAVDRVGLDLHDVARHEHVRLSGGQQGGREPPACGAEE